MPVAQYELAICKNGREKTGTASKNFLQEKQVLLLGNEILSEFYRGKYPKDNKNWHKLTEYTLDRVMALIKAVKTLKQANKDILCNFTGYLVFDCLIGNQDRHHENWGFIIDKKSLALAPSFDHASGVASKVSDEEAQARLTTKDKNYNIETYCKKAITPFYKNGKKLKTFEVVKELMGMQNGIKTHTIEWIDKISKIQEMDYKNILDNIPKDLITQNQKDFILQMLAI